MAAAVFFSAIICDHDVVNFHPEALTAVSLCVYCAANVGIIIWIDGARNEAASVGDPQMGADPSRWR